MFVENITKVILKIFPFFYFGENLIWLCKIFLYFLKSNTYRCEIILFNSNFF